MDTSTPPSDVGTLVAVTGATGHLGNVLVRALASPKTRVRAFPLPHGGDDGDTASAGPDPNETGARSRGPRPLLLPRGRREALFTSYSVDVLQSNCDMPPTKAGRELGFTDRRWPAQLAQHAHSRRRPVRKKGATKHLRHGYGSEDPRVGAFNSVVSHHP